MKTMKNIRLFTLVLAFVLIAMPAYAVSDGTGTNEFRDENLLINNSDDTARAVRFAEPSGSGSNYTGLVAQAQAGNVTYTLPAAAPASNGMVLSATTGGTMSWADPTATSLPDNTATAYNLVDDGDGDTWFLINTTDGSSNISFGNTNENPTYTFLGTSAATFGGDIIVTGGDVSSPAATNLNITAGTSGAVTVDSGTTGDVNIGTGNNAKTISIGNGTAANAINIGTEDTVADTIVIGSASDTVSITGAEWAISTAGVITLDNGETFSNATDSTFTFTTNAAGNPDVFAILPNVAGANTFTGTVTTADLTADRTWTLPDSTGTILLDTTLATTAFIQNGNTFGATGVLGTNDANSLSIETNNTVRATFDTANGLAFPAGMAVTSGNTTNISITTGTTGVVTLDSGTTGNVNVGTGASAKAVTVGNTTGASSTTIKAGTGGIVLNNQTIFTAGTTNIVAGTGVSSAMLNTSYLRIAGSGGAVDISANPQIAAGTAGQIINLECTSGSNTVKFEDGTGLELQSGVPFTMGINDTMQFIYNGTSWIELRRANN